MPVKRRVLPGRRTVLRLLPQPVSGLRFAASPQQRGWVVLRKWWGRPALVPAPWVLVARPAGAGEATVLRLPRSKPGGSLALVQAFGGWAVLSPAEEDWLVLSLPQRAQAMGKALASLVRRPPLASFVRPQPGSSLQMPYSLLRAGYRLAAPAQCSVGGRRRV